jgi:acyl-CoA dehydrogenase
MQDDIARRIDAWLSRCDDPAATPLQGMAETGMLRPLPDYTAIARTKAAIVARTGLLGVAGIWGGRQQVGRHFIEGFGSPAQQALWLGRPLSVSISEPRVGAHPKLLTTRAEPTGAGFRITGEKAWVSNGPEADAIIVVAVTAEAAGRKRYGAFIVPRDTPGLSMREMPGFHALRPSRHCHMTLDGCEVGAEAMLGEAGSAYERMAMPFRDVEDAVGTFSTLGAFRFLLVRLAATRLVTPEPREEPDLSLGGLVALTAVYEAGAEAVVASLDAGRLDAGSATLVGLRILAGEIAARVRTHVETFGPAEAAVETMLTDLDATLSIARLPRLTRQVRLASTVR